MNITKFIKKLQQRQSNLAARGQQISVRRTYIGIGAVSICVSIVAGVAGWNFLADRQETDEIQNDALFPITKDGNVGYVDRAGKIAIPPKFPPVIGSCGNWCMFGNRESRTPILSDFSEGLALVNFKEGLGYIDRTGKTKIAPQGFERADSFKNGLAKVRFEFDREESTYPEGFIDINGKVVGKFAETREFSEGLAFVRIKSKWGAIDRNGKIVIKPQFDEVRDFHEGLAHIQIENSYGFIDKNSKKIFIIRMPYPKAEDFKNGFSLVTYFTSTTESTSSEDGMSQFFIGKSGEILADRQFQRASSFIEGMAAIKIDGKWGFIDTSGKDIIRPQFEAVGDFHEGMAAIKIGGKWGFVDKQGKIAIQPQFTEVNQYTSFTTDEGRENGFRHGLARVKISDKWGYIDKTGKLVIAAKFDAAYEFDDENNGLASVVIGQRWGSIDRTGKIVIEPQFLDRYYFKNGLAAVESHSILDLLSGGAKYGYIDRKGKYIWHPTN